LLAPLAGRIYHHAPQQNARPLDISMPMDPANHFDKPTSSSAQRLLGIVLVVAVGMVLWQAFVGVWGYWTLRGSNGLPLGFWLGCFALSPPLLYLGLNLLAGRFRERRLLSGNALIVCGILLLAASLAIAGLLVWSGGLKSLDRGLIGGPILGALAIMIGKRRRRESEPHADV
jgi:hypothetical protein